MKTGIIYSAFNKVSKKYYIGLTTQNFETRIWQHFHPSKKQDDYISRAMRKYDEADWVWEVLEADIPNSELDDKERYYIAKYNDGYNLYNSTEGGRDNPNAKLKPSKTYNKTILLGDYVFDIPDTEIKEEDVIREKLLDKLFEIANNCLTEHQKKILMLHLDGYGQQKIADMLGIHQTSVYKSLNGNQDYNHGGRRHGGSFKKIKKHCLKDKEFKKLYRKVF